MRLSFGRGRYLVAGLTLALGSAPLLAADGQDEIAFAQAFTIDASGNITAYPAAYFADPGTVDYTTSAQAFVVDSSGNITAYPLEHPGNPDGVDYTASAQDFVVDSSGNITSSPQSHPGNPGGVDYTTTAQAFTIDSSGNITAYPANHPGNPGGSDFSQFVGDIMVTPEGFIFVHSGIVSPMLGTPGLAILVGLLVLSGAWVMVRRRAGEVR